MKVRIWPLGLAACMMLMPLGALYAKTAVTVKADNKTDFAAVVAAVKKEMVPGGRYEFVQGGDRQSVEAGLGDMTALFDKYDTVSKMDADAKIQLYKDQENVNAILTHRDSDRLVCKSERPIGSLLPKRTCRTYGEIEKDHQKSQDFMQEQARPGYVNGGH